MKKLLSLVIFYFSFIGSALALSITDSFTSRANFDVASDMVWNQSRGELHPPAWITGWNDGGFKNTNFSIGDGHHGRFETAADYARFSSGGNVSGQVIRINTNAYSDLQFTSFILQNGWTIRPVGTLPLIIRSQSGITIAGDIDCSGENGENASGDISAIRLGGVSHCGGGAGGSSGVDGTSGGPSVSGGFGAAAGNMIGGVGGGGGGGYSVTVGDDGEDPNVGGANDGGALGTRFLDDGFDDDLNGAGSGGGGGSAFTDAGDLANNSSGAGGGAGGGNIQLYSANDILITGQVLADGGDGGNVGGTLKAGAGGGGAGGSILMFAIGDNSLGSPDTGDIIINAGLVSAMEGAGGTSPSSADGGGGSRGRTWLVGTNGEAIQAGGGVLTPISNLAVVGDGRYKAGAFIAISKAVDMGNSGPTLTSSTYNDDLQGGTITYEIAFGDSASAASLSNFAAPATYYGIEQKRFAKFRFSVTNVGAISPTRVQDVNFIFSGRTENEFDFKGACGHLSGGNSVPKSGSRPGLWNLLFIFAPMGLVLLIRRKNLVQLLSNGST